ncbi:transglycosylase domain-containing protein [Pontibacillus litoralis]|uniref:Uncharacterized protein n=1 Tax=Pontibacillus litoralis JSM 072002 TaxID=1385512 RepID=A0A0A5G0U5_9BACI|nr:PBP1A family penicillin-binding protein [Pontibacillus litoralis]KGX84738.1 hypothetical protein N784_12045 [Pontibacillus litoralis JSM 072002]
MEWNKESIMKWWKETKWKWPIIIVVCLLLLATVVYSALLYGGKRVVDERLFVLNEASTIVTEDGDMLGMLYEENRTLISIDDIPNHVQNAFVAVEDARFYEHSGIDIIAIFRAIYRDLIAMEKVEGGSTITQQLSKNLFLTNEKTWSRKIKEMMSALYLEQHVSKDVILEYYLNTIYFGDGMYGIETASQYYFSKSVNELTIEEGALLAAMPKGPNYYDPEEHPDRAKERRDLVLDRMHEEEMLSAEETVRLQRKSLNLNIDGKEEKPWLHSYMDLVIKEAKTVYGLSEEELYEGGYRIVVGIDEDIQEISYEAMQNDEYFQGSKPGLEGTFTLMDQQTGVIVAAHGGRDLQKGEMNRLFVKQQPGSVMKPLAVYGPALELEAYNPYSMLKDEPISYGEYYPKNYNGQYAGTVSMYDALIASLNAPAVWLMDQIGVDYSKAYLEKMGMDIPDEGLSIALGGLEEGVTPLDLIEGFRTFASNGKAVEPHTILQIYNEEDELIATSSKEETEVFTAQTAWDMTRMLESVVQQGTAQIGTYDKALAGKTGTTQHPYVQGENNDVWFVGYTPEYVGSVWMGYDKIDEQHYVNGGSASPTTLMKDVLTQIDRQQDLQEQFVKPDNVKELQPPIQLPVIGDLDGEIDVGPLSVKADLSWTPADDDRVQYRIYRQSEAEEDELVGEVTGEGNYKVKGASFFRKESYYVVPYDPLTKQEGTSSNVVEVEWRFG